MDIDSDMPQPASVEGIAKVVSVDPDGAWLEPEQGSSCAGCSAVAACGEKGIGTLASRLEQRRFYMAHPETAPRFESGERIVVSTSINALVKGSLTAYLIPMLTLFTAGGIAQVLYSRDGVTLLASVAGLFAGLALARLLARRMAARGDISLHYVRRANTTSVCHPIGFQS